MVYLPITLGIAGQASGTLFSQEGKERFGETLSAEIRQSVFEQDDYTCRFCGFKSKKYQDVSHIDGDRNNLRTDNLATSCIYCQQCFDLEKAAEMRSGMLVWLPEIEQAELNHIARAIYVARISQGSMAETAHAALNILRNRREEVKRRIKTDSPFVLSFVIRDFLTPKYYGSVSEKLKGVRLFPLDRRIMKEDDLEFNQFPQILAYWRSKAGPFGQKMPGQWKNFYAQLAQAK